LLFIVTSCTEKQTVLIDNGVEQIKVKAEIADTPEKRGLGLMYRDKLKETSGMFFVFDNEGTYSFWMKNTLIPLDIIFISGNFEIVDIIKAEPCTEDPCEKYEPEKSAKYILEVNKDFTTKNNIKVGNKITIK